MTLYYASGSPTAELTLEDLRAALFSVLEQLGPRQRVLALPPDITRRHSQAGPLTTMAYEYYGDRLVDVMPALGTHFAMTGEQLSQMFGDLPQELIRVHRWRQDVVTLGNVPAEFVGEVTQGLWTRPWPAQMNRLVAHGGHDLILSIGQVVPHEVIGMANYNKNLFVGTGGVAGINESHYISALWGIERILGQADNPLRRILNYAERLFCRDLPVIYVQTVVGSRRHLPGGEEPTDLDDEPVVRGLFIGDDPECFERAAKLAVEVNFQFVAEPVKKMVVYLEPEEFHSTWLGNKSVYRTRMAIADGGELVVLAPGVRTFGEDPEIDRLIRKYGYRTSPEVMRFVEENADLAANLSAAAHLIHGSSEGRFRITYCAGQLAREEIESVGYAYGNLAEKSQRYRPRPIPDGWHTMQGGERYYFVGRPAIGLWAHRSRLPN
ncbi:MAG: lactate racemase domain-containing protein [Planctomycetes bacterium]|nr:lactate racemase domain-containing protein [Planctomycetota bacterium]